MNIKTLSCLSFFLVFLCSFSSYAAYPGLVCDYSKVKGIVSSIQSDVYHGYNYIEITTPSDSYVGGYIYSGGDSKIEEVMKIAKLSFEYNRDVTICIYDWNVIYGIEMGSEK